MIINSGVSEEEVLNSFENISLQTKEENPDAPKSAEKVEDLLGQPSGKFDYKVFYSKPPSYDIPIESIIPGGWGDKFDDDRLENEKEAETPEQPQRGVEDLLGQPSGKFDYKVFYSKPPSYPIKSIVLGGWGDEFDDDKPARKEDQKIEDTEQPQEEAKEEIMPSNRNEPLNKKNMHDRSVERREKRPHNRSY